MLHGYQAGVTTLTEAAQILEQSDWVGEVTLDWMGNSFYWTWSERQPVFIDAHQVAVIQPDDTVNFVQGMSIQTTLPIGYIALTGGELSNFRIALYGVSSRLARKSLAFYSISYSNYPLILENFVACPFRWIKIWNLPAYIHYREPSETPVSNWRDHMEENSWCL